MTPEQGQRIVADVNAKWAIGRCGYPGMPAHVQSRVAKVVAKQPGKQAVIAVVNKAFKDWLRVAVGPIRRIS